MNDSADEPPYESQRADEGFLQYNSASSTQRASQYPANIYLFKVINRKLQKDVKYMFNNVILVFLMLTLNIYCQLGIYIAAILNFCVFFKPAISSYDSLEIEG